MAPQLPVEQIVPGMLFLAKSPRDDSCYRGVVLSIEGRKVHTPLSD